jgi:hypothetical protein
MTLEALASLTPFEVAGELSKILREFSQQKSGPCSEDSSSSEEWSESASLEAPPPIPASQGSAAKTSKWGRLRVLQR